jgi:hypothetical protein
MGLVPSGADSVRRVDLKTEVASRWSSAAPRTAEEASTTASGRDSQGGDSMQRAAGLSRARVRYSLLIELARVPPAVHGEETEEEHSGPDEDDREVHQQEEQAGDIEVNARGTWNGTRPHRECNRCARKEESHDVEELARGAHGISSRMIRDGDDRWCTASPERKNPGREATGVPSFQTCRSYVVRDLRRETASPDTSATATARRRPPAPACRRPRERRPSPRRLTMSASSRTSRDRHAAPRPSR